MPVVVQKYGGSSVADLEKLGLVADQVAACRRAGNDVVVVVSAMGKTTENLLALARRAARTHGTQSSEPPRRELDMLLSTGERVSMSLLSIALQARGCIATSLTGSQSGIVTNDRHFEARIVEVRPHRVEDELARGAVVIVAGYQGMSYRREITTLGRGGSDTTAVARAASLGADRCEIYSDVDGVYSSDPRRVGDARHVSSLDYELMQEAALCGAKVLNAEAVEWARRHGVRIHARRSADGTLGRETVVSERPLAAGTFLVVADADVVEIIASRARLPDLLRACDALEIELADVTADDGAARALLPLSRLADPESTLSALRRGTKGASVVTGLGTLSLIGRGLCPATIGHALSRLPQAPRGVIKGALRLCAVLHAAELPAAETAWHGAFCEPGVKAA